MTQEDKAKAYDKAKYIMKEYLESGNAGVVAENTIKKAFPELAETDDERIRKELITHIKWCEDSGYCAKEEMTRWIAWIEKQGEQILANSVKTCKDEQEPVFEMKTPEESLGIDSDTYNKIVDECIYGEQKPADKVDQHSLPVSDNSSLPTFDESIYHPCTEKVHEKKSSWSEEDEAMLNDIISDAEQWEDLDDVQINWLKSLKDRVQLKQEWDEEDETWLTDIVCKLESDCQLNKDEMTWLKSIRPRSHWKPSEEQMKALRAARATFGVDDVVLASLIYDLEKLIE